MRAPYEYHSGMVSSPEPELPSCVEAGQTALIYRQSMMVWFSPSTKPMASTIGACQTEQVGEILPQAIIDQAAALNPYSSTVGRYMGNSNVLCLVRRCETRLIVELRGLLSVLNGWHPTDRDQRRGPRNPDYDHHHWEAVQLTWHPWRRVDICLTHSQNALRRSRAKVMMRRPVRPQQPASRSESAR